MNRTPNDVSDRETEHVSEPLPPVGQVEHMIRDDVIDPADAAVTALGYFLRSVGRNVRRDRKARELTCADFGSAVAMREESVSQIELGKQNVTMDVLGRLALGLDIPMHELLANIEVDPALVSYKKPRNTPTIVPWISRRRQP